MTTIYKYDEYQKREEQITKRIQFSSIEQIFRSHQTNAYFANGCVDAAVYCRDKNAIVNCIHKCHNGR